MSLLEVLVSIGVLSLGLVFVILLIPVGLRAIAETARADRAAACARAASRDLLVRNMLDRHEWYDPSGTCAADQLGPGPTVPIPYALASQLLPLFPAPGGVPLLGQAFVIDPLQTSAGLGAGIVATDLGKFPYKAASPCPILCRLSFGNPTVLPQAFYSRIFTWSDDQHFEMPQERDRRPKQFFTMTNGSFDTDPIASAAVRQSEGHYSWLVTLMPSADETPPVTAAGTPDYDALAQDHQRTYTVSVAVFSRRDLDLAAPQPPERWVAVESAGGGALGNMVSDVRLRLDQATRASDYRAEYLDVKRNQWILLCGQKPDPRLPAPQLRTIAQWYRVVAADEPVEDTTNHIWTRYLTLAGPDWDTAATPAFAILLDGVIDVHTTTVELGQ